MTDQIILSPESFKTLYLRAENGIILTTEAGRRIIVERIVGEEWTPYRLYEFELAKNENKRNILLVDKKYLPQIEKELGEKIKL
jgi:hypothetical protein